MSEMYEIAEKINDKYIYIGDILLIFFHIYI